MTESTQANASAGFLRAPGLAVTAVIVVLGILPGAAYFHYKAPLVKAQVMDKLRSAATEPNEKLDVWLGSCEPQIQGRLSKLTFSSSYPWLVTHTVELEGAEPEIWGLDLNGAEPATIVREGLRVEVRLPGPRLLGHGTLTGDNARHIPHYARRADAADPVQRAEELVVWFLPMVEALPKDIPGAELVVQVGPLEAAPAAAHGPR